jgi:L-2-amino-thiazoline-4-carboxylic acid hydrolase
MTMKRPLLALKPWLAARARRSLTPRFGKRRARQLLDDAFERHARDTPSNGTSECLGGRLMLEAAALTVALYDVLVAEGLAEADARAEVARVTAAIYDVMAKPPWLIARLAARSPHRRLKLATDAFRRFPFSEPAYLMKDVAADARTVAFDVVRCPVAEYMAQKGLAELCVESWCNLDFALAERWGASLERTMTLAGGAERCDFRWHSAGKSG